MEKKKKYINQYLFLLLVLVMICVKDISVKAQEFPTLVPDGEYVTSTVTENEHADYSCSFKLIIEKSGYYFFKEKTENDIWWTVKRELNAGSWWFGQSVWYLEEGIYYIGAETYSGSGYPCVKVFSAECEFDLSKVQNSFETTNLVYSSNDVVKQWTDNASVKVSLSNGSSFTTSLEGVWLRPVLYKKEKALYAIGNTDYDKQEYVTGGDYEVRLMNYVESYCQDSKEIKIKTCSVSNIPETNFDKDIQIKKNDKYALNVTKPSYIFIKNADPVFVDSNGNVIESDYSRYEELVNEEEDIYNDYSYVYISKPQTVYLEYFGEYDRVTAFYQMQMSVNQEKNLSQMQYYNEMLSKQLEKTCSNYKVTLTSEGGKVISSTVDRVFETITKIDGSKDWEELSVGEHEVVCLMPDGKSICSFTINTYGSIKNSDSVEEYNDSGEINIKNGEIQYIKIKPEHAGNYILIDNGNINLKSDEMPEYVAYGRVMMEDDEIIYGNTKVSINSVYNMEANEELYIELDNTEGKLSKILFAEKLGDKITKLPNAIQDVDGSQNAGWLIDKLNKDVTIAMETTMGTYNLDFDKWGCSSRLVIADSVYEGYEISRRSVLLHGDKFYYIVKNEDGAELCKIKITINNTSYKPTEQSQQQNAVTTEDVQNSIVNATSVSSVNINDVVNVNNIQYKIINIVNEKIEVSYQTPENTKATSYVVPDTVTLADGTVANVTEVAPNAFKKCKKIKKVVLGKNIEKVGKNAFNGCKKLKTITIKSTKLIKKSFGKNAFKGINKKATITVPKKVYKNYKKWINSAGAPKSVKIKKK